jgi:GNAT superfamily N-acetyltransferase
MFSDRGLSRRLERAEGHACVQFARAHRRLVPDSGVDWIECAGAYAVFDGIDSPVTQSFGLGLFADLTPASLDEIEHFFFERGASADHEVSPLAGLPVLELLTARHYAPVEISSVLYQPVQKVSGEDCRDVTIHVAGPGEQEIWTNVNVRGWGHEHPEICDFLLRTTTISFAREDCICFLAEIDGQTGAAGALCLYDSVALFAGAATVPELRCRGLQRALLRERMRYAFEHGCDLAMMVAEAGSKSQRNAEREGFSIAYTRTKWRLCRQA